MFGPNPSRTVNVIFQMDNNQIPEVIFGVEGLRKFLQRIEPTTACGHHDIPAAVLKNCSGILCFYFSRLFTECLSKSCLPRDWKLARFVLIHKGGSRSAVENYRLVSLTSITCKVMEHVIYTSIM